MILLGEIAFPADLAIFNLSCEYDETVLSAEGWDVPDWLLEFYSFGVLAIIVPDSGKVESFSEGVDAEEVFFSLDEVEVGKLLANVFLGWGDGILFLED